MAGFSFLTFGRRQSAWVGCGGRPGITLWSCSIDEESLPPGGSLSRLWWAGPGISSRGPHLRTGATRIGGSVQPTSIMGPLCCIRWSPDLADLGRFVTICAESFHVQVTNQREANCFYVALLMYVTWAMEWYSTSMIRDLNVVYQRRNHTFLVMYYPFTILVLDASGHHQTHYHIHIHGLFFKKKLSFVRLIL